MLQILGICKLNKIQFQLETFEESQQMGDMET